MQYPRRSNGSKRWSGLRLRTTISFVGVLVATALLLELLIGIIFFVVITHVPIVDQNKVNAAQQAAQTYALEASVLGGGDRLDPRTTFQPGLPFSLSFQGENGAASIPYTGTRLPAAPFRRPPVEDFALLIAPNGQVIASSYPARYPVMTSIASLLPAQSRLVHNALAGRADSSVLSTPPGQTAFVAQPVWSKQKEPIGAIYVQLAATGSTSDILSFLRAWLGTALFWIIITVPPGVIFGMMTTRSLIRRLHRLVLASDRFANGDYTQRVPVTQQDEIGQLEAQFNSMAQQLVESFAQRQKLIEQHARKEERAHIEQELQMAQIIQRSLLPKDRPDLPGWQIETYYQSAREVGGDLYDFLTLENGCIGLVIGDVSDKGMPAALIMASTRSMLRAAAQITDSPAEVLAHVNDLLYADTPARMFVTCFYAVLDPATGRLRYANAGHDLPIKRDADTVDELYATGMPLGLMPGMHYDEREVSLQPGEYLLFYSDGLVEAHDPERKMFGFPRLKALLAEHAESTSLISFLLEHLKSFTGPGWEQEDDMTLLTLQNISNPASPVEVPEQQDEPRVLREWSIASVAGNERAAMEQVAEAVASLHLPADRLANLKTAVAETVMNAMEHGNSYQPDKDVTLQVLASASTLIVRVQDQGEGPKVPTVVAEPDLDAKLHSSQTARGWGLFLIHQLVDEVHRSGDEHHHTVELIMHL